jgi:hypothetical protein
MNKRLVLIDADGLLYHSSRDTIEESLTTIDEKINNILEKTEATHYSLFISQGKYFRHSIFPEYKQNRTKSPTQLKWIKTLRQYLVEKYNAVSMNGVEADDLINYWYNKTFYISKDGNYCYNEVRVEGTVDAISYQLRTFEKEDIVRICNRNCLFFAGRYVNSSLFSYGTLDFK